MVIIIAHHFGVHGINPYFHTSFDGLSWSIHDLPWQYIFTQFVCWGGNLGNSIFILITGYFMINRRMNYKKILSLLGALFFYSWIIALILYGAHLIPFSHKNLIKSLIPIWVGANWFVSCYIIFSLFIPFFNYFLNRISRQSYVTFLVIFYSIFLFLPAFKFQSFMGGGGIPFFMLVYAIGGYIRLYGNEYTRRGSYFYLRKAGVCIACIIFVVAVSIIAGGVLHKFNLMEGSNGRITFLQVPLAAFLFMSFLTMKPFYSNAVNRIAGAMLGVYLIHDNDLMRPFIWHQLFPNIDFIYSNWYVAFYAAKVLCVLVVCIGIELFRKKLIEPVIMKCIDRHYSSLEQKVSQVISKCANLW